MRKELLVFMIMIGAVSASWAEESLSVFLPGLDGKMQLLEGTRPEILESAGRFTEEGNYDHALRCYLTLLERDASDVRSRLLLGQLYQFQLDDYAKAVTAYKKAEKYVPDNQPEQKAYVLRLSAEAYRELAEKKGSLVYYAQAISDYERILDFQPENSEIWYRLGVASLNGRDFKRAIQAFEQVIGKDPKSDWAEESRRGLRLAKKEARSQR